MTSKAWTIGGVGALFLGAGAFGLTHLYSKPTAAAGPAVPEELTVEKIRQTSQDDPGKMFEKMRETMDRGNLSEEQKQKIRENMREAMESEIQKRVDEYYAAKDAEEQEAILNRHIDEFVKMRKRFEQQRQEEEAKEAEKAEKDGKPEKEREAERERDRDRWRKSMASQTREQRKTRSETRDPNQTAQRMAYKTAMTKQMQKRGIEPPRFGPGGPGGFGGRRP